MERILLNCRTTSLRGTTCLKFRVTDGYTLSMSYSTGRKVANEKLCVFTPEGTLRPRVTVYDACLKADIESYLAAIDAAYRHMKTTGMDMRSDVLQAEADRRLHPGSPAAILHPTRAENLVQRFLRYVEEAWRDGIIGQDRRLHYYASVRRMARFLYIQGRSQLPPEQFDVKMLMDYRAFVADEYLYVPQYPKLYAKKGRHRYPERRLSTNSVVHEMQGLRAFFNELEHTDECYPSPFRQLSRVRFRTLMRTRKDEPFFLRREELRKVIETEVPSDLQTAKDIFVLNCCTGARIGDFLRWRMEQLALSEEGIPYLRYLPHKTLKTMEQVTEIRTPLVRVAYEIVLRTRLDFGMSARTYNRSLRRLLRFCGIDRPVARFSEASGRNEYFPLHAVASSRLARKTHVDIMNKVQIDAYAAGLHAEGSHAVFRYTRLELADRFALMNLAFGQADFRLTALSPPAASGPGYAVGTRRSSPAGSDGRRAPDSRRLPDNGANT